MLPGPTKRSRMIRRAEHEQLRACRTRPGAEWLLSDEPGLVDDEDEPNDDGDFLDFEAGHGTFIAGIIRQICPDAEVHIAGVLSSFGDGDVLVDRCARTASTEGDRRRRHRRDELRH